MTTELAPIFARSPTSIGPSSLAPEPTTTSSPTVGWRLPRCEPGAAERHALVERHVVADLSRLADHDARPVIDEQRLADPRRRMDLDAGDDLGQVGEEARHERHARLVQRVRDAVRQQRLDAAVGQQDLAAGRRRGPRDRAPARRRGPRGPRRRRGASDAWGRARTPEALAVSGRDIAEKVTGRRRASLT